MVAEEMVRLLKHRQVTRFFVMTGSCVVGIWKYWFVERESKERYV